MPPSQPADPERVAERRSNARTIRKVAPYLWPDGEAWVNGVSCWR